MTGEDPSPEAPLSERARQFAYALGWSEDFNATAAAKSVGYKGKHVRQTAAALKRDPRVKAIVEAILEERAGETRIKAALALEELALVMKSDLSHYRIDDAGHVRVKPSAPPGAMRAVASIKRKRREIPQGKGEAPIVIYETELRLYDKNAAIGNALKHLGLLKDLHEHTGKDGAPIEHAHTLTVRFVKPGEVAE